MGERLRPFSSAWLAPAALAARLKAEEGAIVGGGIASIGAGIGQGIVRSQERRERESEIARSEAHYQDALARQDRQDEVSLLKTKMETMELLRQGVSKEIGMSVESGDEPDAGAVERLKTILSGQQSLQSQLLGIATRSGQGAATMPTTAADLSDEHPKAGDLAYPGSLLASMGYKPSDYLDVTYTGPAPGSMHAPGVNVDRAPSAVPDTYEATMARRLQVEAEVARISKAMDKYKDVASPGMASVLAKQRSRLGALTTELATLKAHEVVVGKQEEQRRKMEKKEPKSEEVDAWDEQMRAGGFYEGTPWENRVPNDAEVVALHEEYMKGVGPRIVAERVEKGRAEKADALDRLTQSRIAALRARGIDVKDNEDPTTVMSLWDKQSRADATELYRKEMIKIRQDALRETERHNKAMENLKLVADPDKKKAAAAYLSNAAMHRENAKKYADFDSPLFDRKKARDEMEEAIRASDKADEIIMSSGVVVDPKGSSPSAPGAKKSPLEWLNGKK